MYIYIYKKKIYVYKNKEIMRNICIFSRKGRMDPPRSHENPLDVLEITYLLDQRHSPNGVQ